MNTKEIARLLKLFKHSLDVEHFNAEPDPALENLEVDKVVQDVLAVLEDLDWDATVENAVAPSSFVVQALLRDDNDVVRETVEAEPWLKTLGDEDLAYLCQDPGANETADGLYYWYDAPKRDTQPAWGVQVARRLGQYLTLLNEASRDQSCGFCVRLHERGLHKWVQENRPEAWKLYAEA